VLPFFEVPVVVAEAAGPPAFELPPAVFEGDWASAQAVESTIANTAIQIAFISCSSRSEAIDDRSESSDQVA
jgi:hypothetical protein